MSELRIQVYIQHKNKPNLFAICHRIVQVVGDNPVPQLYRQMDMVRDDAAQIYRNEGNVIWFELESKSNIEKQSKADSFMEAVCNTLIGFWISVAANYAILPLFGYTPRFIDSIGIAGLFTIVSIVRSYILRRLFNGKSVWAAIKSKVS